ncbi:sugar ABC transporter substrate-binding protein [Streptomyces clavuligerus]|uniref:Periplasmic binding protein/LacI transcriptional regulator n=1 Tax=Streptomyces clavuligerus TaxID=1901 RepID=E2PWC7_STRCL|nr:sugar ABC transporter substrate-binding protein [Streptomyces clavuligerus]ANW20973.1 ABC transporter substrate-binding protein [Streptomyces clavuligerus]AXU15591.1 sugar ABC transporter substrate-binding protein [Streptomyces clavuligerus]EFG05960.1 periplasmic binding protein/LacI transcriptional regulator [Streptomyces clavuligerus]MBY6305702.1 sugar ABC transporter substrate-binding protein [Streptomyces clavuligerus]QCS08370.1 sugar ABC transporter substrate-binding protein [Streptomy
MRARTTTAAVLAVLLAGTALTGCNRDPGGAGAARVGIDLPRSDSDFWNSYQGYIEKGVEDGTVEALPLTNSQNDVGRLVANVQTLTDQGARAVVMAPQDTGAITESLRTLAERKIPVVSVDTRPDQGEVYMVVRADNRAYGEKACRFLGERLGGRGKVAEFQGDLSSINGRDRSEAFSSCMKRDFPGIRVFELATDWKGDVASAKLQATLAAHPDLNGLYLQAGGVFLQPTLALLEQKKLLKPAGAPGHLTIVSNDGIPEELDAIRAGKIDATVSQPADLYAEYALFYARAALDGKTFSTGPTDHGSTVVRIPGGLEDQLPAPLVTRENVDDPALWANRLEKPGRP